MSEEEVRINSRDLAELLALDLGGDAKVWEYRLAGWRRTSRKGAPPIAHSMNQDGTARYLMKDVMTFIGTRQMRDIELAKATSAAAPSTIVAATAASPSNKEAHVRLGMKAGDILVLCELAPHTARRLAATLISAADEVEEILLKKKTAS